MNISSAVVQGELDYREIVDCPLCGGASYHPVTEAERSDYGSGLPEPFRTMKFQMVECDDCRTTYQRNRPNAQHIGQYYETGEYHCYESLMDRGAIIRNAAILTARKQTAEIDKHRPHKTDLVVDFGCGSGSWIELFKHAKAPWQIVGTEIFPDLCAAVERNTGEKCVVADHDTIASAFPAGSVDAIFMHHVIEHLPDPVAFLRKASIVLTEGGIVCGQTPNCRAWERRIFGTNWVQWHLPHHLVIFDYETMAAHAKKAGFEVVSLSSSLSGATQWAASFLKWFARLRGRQYKYTREPLHAPLTLLAAPLAALQSLISCTSHMDFVLRKMPKTGL